MFEVIVFYWIFGIFNYLMYIVFIDMNDYYSFYEKIILINFLISGFVLSFVFE